MYAHTRIVMSAKGNDASYMQSVLEIAYFKSILRFMMNLEPSFSKDCKLSQSHLSLNVFFI